MEAVRCTQCGETRWSMLPGSLASSLEAACELCGGETRRSSGAGPVRAPRTSTSSAGARTIADRIARHADVAAR